MTDTFITGYKPGTDEVETSTDYLFSQNRTMVRVIRLLPGRRLPNRRLKLAMLHQSLTAPAPYEFLWTPRLALGALDVWWSVINSVDRPGYVEVIFQTREGGWGQLVNLDLMQDTWEAIQKDLFERFLVQWQRGIDAAWTASEVSLGEFSASE